MECKHGALDVILLFKREIVTGCCTLFSLVETFKISSQPAWMRCCGTDDNTTSNQYHFLEKGGKLHGHISLFKLVVMSANFITTSLNECMCLVSHQTELGRCRKLRYVFCTICFSFFFMSLLLNLLLRYFLKCRQKLYLNGVSVEFKYLFIYFKVVLTYI